jgi:hypothetical protein
MKCAIQKNATPLTPLATNQNSGFQLKSRLITLLFAGVGPWHVVSDGAMNKMS